jgi:S-DNA-T family DNA segregation ATPase FtsK/SpoIIIE
MATNREMLKEAIADAKAVKETAIANAKAALEEAFTPQLTSMFSMKLQEMEIEEGLEEMYDNSEEKMEEAKDMDNMEEAEYMEEAEDTMEIDLEELLAELNEEEDDTLNEAEEGEEEESEEEESEESEESEEGEEEGEPIDLEDMTDEDLKSMIEDVIKDMIEAGELEAGHEGMENEEGAEGEEEIGIEDEEEVDLAELLREIEEMEEVEEMEEGIGNLFKGAATKFIAANKSEADKIMAMDDKAAALKAAESLILKFRKEQLDKGQLPPAVRADVSDLRQKLGLSSLGGDSDSVISINREGIEKELAEAYSTIETLKDELNEINLLNAKLLYTNKIFKAKNLNESQKVKVLSSFDKAKNVGEVKMVFETLNEGIKVSKNTIKEHLGSASKGTITPSVKKPIVESNEAFTRMQKLAGII